MSTEYLYDDEELDTLQKMIWKDETGENKWLIQAKINAILEKEQKNRTEEFKFQGRALIALCSMDFISIGMTLFWFFLFKLNTYDHYEELCNLKILLTSIRIPLVGQSFYSFCNDFHFEMVMKLSSYARCFQIATDTVIMYWVCFIIDVNPEDCKWIFGSLLCLTIICVFYQKYFLNKIMTDELQIQEDVLIVKCGWCGGYRKI